MGNLIQVFPLPLRKITPLKVPDLRLDSLSLSYLDITKFNLGEMALESSVKQHQIWLATSLTFPANSEKRPKKFWKLSKVSLPHASCISASMSSCSFDSCKHFESSQGTGLPPCFYVKPASTIPALFTSHLSFSAIFHRHSCVCQSTSHYRNHARQTLQKIPQDHDLLRTNLWLPASLPSPPRQCLHPRMPRLPHASPKIPRKHTPRPVPPLHHEVHPREDHGRREDPQTSRRRE